MKWIHLCWLVHLSYLLYSWNCISRLIKKTHYRHESLHVMSVSFRFFFLKHVCMVREHWTYLVFEIKISGLFIQNLDFGWVCAMEIYLFCWIRMVLKTTWSLISAFSCRILMGSINGWGQIKKSRVCETCYCSYRCDV